MQHEEKNNMHFWRSRQFRLRRWWQVNMNVRQTWTQQCENCSWSCWTAVVHSSLTVFSCRLGTLARDDCSFQMVADDGWVCESSDIEALGAWVKKLKLTGLGAVGRCEPGECTSHRNRRSVRKFLSRPTTGGQRGERGKSGQRAALLHWRMADL